MTEIRISLARGPDDEPVGWLSTGSGDVLAFTGWLRLIRALEDELQRAPQAPDSGSPPDPSLRD
jgi:hypothetical protein